MRGLNPVPDEMRTGIAQQALFTTLHEKPALLRQVPWVKTGGRRGVMDTNELERQALINDFEFHGIPIQMRLASLDVLRAIYGPDATELRLMGPGRMAWAMPDQRVPDEEYVITERWADYPAFFANVLNHRAAEDPELGAAWTRMVKTRSRDDNGEESVSYRPEPHPARRLLEWRTPADKVAGERDSGLIIPATALPQFLADGDETADAPPASNGPADPNRIPPRKGR